MTAARLHRLQLTNFRSYRAAKLDVARDMVVLVGPNGAGKTNLLEAISFFVPGRGLRRATLDEVAFSEGDGSWAVSIEVEGTLGLATLGTGIEPPHEREIATSRQCRIDREPVGSAAAFADHLRVHLADARRWTDCSPAPPPSGGVFSTGLWSRSMPTIAAAFRRSSVPCARAIGCLKIHVTIRIGSTRSSTRPPNSRSRSQRCARKPSSGCRTSSRKAARSIPVSLCGDFAVGLDRADAAQSSGDRDRGPLSRRAAREPRARCRRRPHARWSASDRSRSGLWPEKYSGRGCLDRRTEGRAHPSCPGA